MPWGLLLLLLLLLLLVLSYFDWLCTCDTEEGHDGAMGVVSLALLHLHHHHQSLAAPLLPRKSSLAGQHHNYHLALSPQTVILSFKLASAH